MLRHYGPKFSFEDSLPMPESIAEAALWANVRYPQTVTGLRLCIGNAATEAVIQQETDFAALACSKVTDEQTDKLMKTTEAIHAVYKIGCRLRGLDEKHDESTYTGDRLASLTHQSMMRVISTTADYAQVTLPGAPALPALPVFFMANKSSSRIAAEEGIISELFSRSLIRRTLRPEAVALSGMWRAGADSLKSSQAIAISQSYRKDLSTLSSPDINSGEWQKIASRVTVVIYQLRRIVRENIIQSLPDTAKRGRVPDKSVIDAFLDSTVAAVQPPKMPSRFLAF